MKNAARMLRFPGKTEENCSRDQGGKVH